MTKRQKFIIATIILTLGIVAIRYPILQWRFRMLFYALAAGFLSFWGLYDVDLVKIKRLMIPAMPAIFAVGAALSFPLLPPIFENFLVWPISYDTGLILAFGLKFIYLAVFAVGYYAAMLCGNIYNVASLRTIQLLRAAHSIGFILALASSLFFFQIIASLHLDSFFNLVLVFAVSFPLILINLWAILLTEKVGERLIILALFLALIIAELAWAVSFWPFTVSVWALYLSAAFYVLVGVAQYLLSEKLFNSTIREFIVVSVVIFLLVFFTASWTG